MKNIKLPALGLPIDLCLGYCREQNGRPDCKNCGLDQKIVDLSIAKVIEDCLPEELGKTTNNGSLTYDAYTDGWNSCLKAQRANLKEKYGIELPTKEVKK